jgi:DNA (cytosine-5)-methyltransferase 1
MKCLSLFSGIGGFDIALEKQNHTIIGACEIDQYARSVYARHFPNIKIYEDATRINPKDLPDFDMLCAGFPCQAFSIAGKRLGFNDTRGNLFYEIARIAKEKKPEYLLLENVKGLLNHDNGKTFIEIINTLDEIGYNIQWQVINSKYFLPQNRERIYIIGHFREKSKRKILHIESNSETNDKERKLIKVGNVDTKGHNSLWGRVYDPKAISSTINANGGGLGGKTGLYAIPTLTPDRINKRQMGRRFKTKDEPAFTITSQDRHGVMIGNRIRRLTPLECERLQGFPDNWTIGLSDAQRYKCCGNAVTVPVVEFILKNLI